MRYVIESTGQTVDVPLLPGLALRGDRWYARAARDGFKKTQLLENAALAKPPRTASRPTSSAAAARSSSMEGPAVRLSATQFYEAPGDMDTSTFSPRPPSTAPASARGRSRSRPATAQQQRDAAFDASAPALTESMDAFTLEAVGHVERPGVLRFAAYFTESTDFSFSGEIGYPVNLGVQVRKCFVLYHLEDATVEIVEERAVNSGVAGGRFYNRAPPSAAGGGWRPKPPPRAAAAAAASSQAPQSQGERAAAALGPRNLVVGGELLYLGQCFHLVDADGYTRRWYAETCRFEQPPPRSYPAESPRTYTVEHSTGLIADPNNLERMIQATDCNRKSSDAAAKASQMSKERQFFRHSVHDVLNFAAEWRDMSPGGITHRYALKYYLADNCCEIVSPPMAGYDRFPLLLARQPLPLNWEGVAQRGERPRFAQVSDLIIGNTLEVYNRAIRITDCSEATRRWYAAKMGFHQPPALVVVNSARVAPPRAGGGSSTYNVSTPSHSPTKFASGRRGGATPEEENYDEDETSDPFLQTEASKSPHQKLAETRAKPRNMEREVRVAGKSIRCRLVLCDRDGTEKGATKATGPTTPVETVRTFVLTYYLMDDTLGIYEEHIPNSGVMGGTFLKRGKYKTTPLTGGHARFFQASDLYIGALLVFSAHNTMKVTEVDGASLKTMMACADEFPFSDTRRCLKKFLEALRFAAPLDLRAEFFNTTTRGGGTTTTITVAHRDEAYPGAIDEAAFVPKLERMGLLGNFNAQEKVTLAMAFRAHTGGKDAPPYYTDLHRVCDTMAFQHAAAEDRDLDDDLSLDEVSLISAHIAAKEADDDFLAALVQVPVLLRKSLEAAAIDKFGPKKLPKHVVARVLEQAACNVRPDHLDFIADKFGDPVDYHALCDHIYCTDFST